MEVRTLKNQIQTLFSQAKEKLNNSKLIIVSNRAPYINKWVEDEIKQEKTIGGLVTALDPVAQFFEDLVIWIAHGGGDADKEVANGQDKIWVPSGNPKYPLRFVWLNKNEIEGYYNGFANQCLWPLFHNAWIKPKFEENHWKYYKAINKRFAEVILEEIGQEHAFVALQDFHMALCAKYIKQERPDIPVGLFWHTPWNNPEICRACPWIEEILEGLLSADLLGFQINQYCTNFLATVDKTLESRIDYETSSVSYQGHNTLVKDFPISIDFEYFSTRSEQIGQDEIDRLKRRYNLRNEIIALAVARVDYTKGIPEMLHAVDRFLKKYPEYQGKFTLVLIGAPSREQIEDYKKLYEEINRLVYLLDAEYKEGRYSAIKYLNWSHTIEELNYWYKLAKLGMITPIHDGMNITAKEYIACKTDNNGVLILSEQAGASRELTDAILVSPHDTEKFADAIKEAVDLIEYDQEEMQRRMKKQREVVQKNDIVRWTNKFITTLTEIELAQ